MTNKEPQRRFRATDPYLDQREADAASRVAKSLWLSQGREVFTFEEEFAKYTGIKNAIAVSSGTAAVVLLVDALLQTKVIKPGAKILTTPLTFVSDITAIVKLGCKPVFSDIVFDYKSPSYLTLDPEIVRKKGFDAILSVNLLGFKGKSGLRDLERPLMEDFGNCITSKGRMGMIQSWSFFPAHHMTTGEGGMVTCDGEQLAKVVRSIKEYGRMCYTTCKYPRCPQVLDPTVLCPNVENRLRFNYLGWNFKMTEINAAIGRVQLSKASEILEKRQRNARLLSRELDKLRHFGLVTPKYSDDVDWFAFPIVVESLEEKKALQEYLRKEGVETRQILGGHIPDQPCMQSVKYEKLGKLENSKFVSDHGFIVGVHPKLTEKEIRELALKFKKFYEGRK